ncbi:leucine-rich repeat-containing G-protein coupled receptor 5-like [Trachinotus anak]|uniref:leucine-rich repeat-containing G-protein coupled receptor 5-like n=1 Tax=Trachinotus anak TaxID=443729 RepID=UPI0039F1F88F
MEVVFDEEHLHDNRIHSLGQRSFTGLINLENLDLSFNRIHSFPTAIRSLSSLRALNIWNNPLHTVGPSCFQLLPELRTLSVSTASPSLSLRGSGSAEGPHALDLSSVSLGGPNLQLRVSQQQQHTLRVSELRLKVLRCVGSTSLQDSSGLSTSCLDSLHFIFIISIVLNLLVLLSILLLPSAPRPPSSLRLPSVILWFRLLAGLSGSSIVSADWFCGSSLETDPGSGVFLSSLCSEVCVFIMMGAVVEAKTRTRSCFQISGVVCCSLALTLVVMETSLWTHSSALVLFNTFCFLFMILTHITRHSCQNLRGDREEAASLTVLLTHALIFFSASLLGLSSLLSPDVSTCAVLIVSSLPCCVDPVILILGPWSGFLQQTLPELKKSQCLSVSL